MVHPLVVGELSILEAGWPVRILYTFWSILWVSWSVLRSLQCWCSWITMIAMFLCLPLTVQRRMASRYWRFLHTAAVSYNHLTEVFMAHLRNSTIQHAIRGCWRTQGSPWPFMTWLDGLVVRFHWRWHPQSSLLAFECRVIILSTVTFSQMMNSSLHTLQIGQLAYQYQSPFQKLVSHKLLLPHPLRSPIHLAVLHHHQSLAHRQLHQECWCLIANSGCIGHRFSYRCSKFHHSTHSFCSSQSRASQAPSKGEWKKIHSPEKKGKKSGVNWYPSQNGTGEAGFDEKTRVRAKTKVRASTKAAAKPKVCKKQLKFKKSSADLEINRGEALLFLPSGLKEEMKCRLIV